MTHDTREALIAASEDLGNGIFRTWLAERTAVVYISQGTTREAVDTWERANLEDLAAWPSDRPYRALQEISRSGLTLYNQQAALNILRGMPPGLIGRSATVLAPGVLGQGVRLFGRRLVRQGRRTSGSSSFLMCARPSHGCWLLCQAPSSLTNLPDA
ncbi:MAG: hypothetical protein HC915_19450 [Anaerolineae bacterium]|nr:hypothetical protein [Anaerolineae bacterium]